MRAGFCRGPAGGLRGSALWRKLFSLQCRALARHFSTLCPGRSPKLAVRFNAKTLVWSPRFAGLGSRACVATRLDAAG